MWNLIFSWTLGFWETGVKKLEIVAVAVAAPFVGVGVVVVVVVVGGTEAFRLAGGGEMSLSLDASRFNSGGILTVPMELRLQGVYRHRNRLSLPRGCPW